MLGAPARAVQHVLVGGELVVVEPHHPAAAFEHRDRVRVVVGAVGDAVGAQRLVDRGVGFQVAGAVQGALLAEPVDRQRGLVVDVADAGVRVAETALRVESQRQRQAHCRGHREPHQAHRHHHPEPGEHALGVLVDRADAQAARGERDAREDREQDHHAVLHVGGQQVGEVVLRVHVGGDCVAAEVLMMPLRPMRMARKGAVRPHTRLVHIVRIYILTIRIQTRKLVACLRNGKIHIISMSLYNYNDTIIAIIN